MQAAEFRLSGGGVPVYVQIRQQILAAITRGALEPGEQLPTVREIAVALRVNPNTVNRSFIELEREGILETFRGRGTFVSGRPRKARPRARHVLREIASRALREAAESGFAGRALLDQVAALLRIPS
ncbi:MAG TPA: GntR family transcriptional regulator [Candidatus Dormibacteraeota bacterium]|nr:GntR family transcriptional regulator [Candidatus Dormibacteraeota bacterium]